MKRVTCSGCFLTPDDTSSSSLRSPEEKIIIDRSKSCEREGRKRKSEAEKSNKNPD